MQKAAISANGRYSLLGQNQQAYMRQKIAAVAWALSQHAQGVHPEFSVDYSLNPALGTFDMSVSFAKSREPRKHVAYISGLMQLKWAHNQGRGKNLAIRARVCTGANASDCRDIDWHGINSKDERRDFVSALTESLQALGALPDSPKKAERKTWLQQADMQIELWRIKDLSEKFFEAMTSVDVQRPGPDMRPAINKALVRMTDNFERRYVIRNPILQAADLRYDESKRSLVGIITIAPQHAKAEPKLKFEWPVTVRSHGERQFFYIEPDARFKLPHDASYFEIGGKESSRILMNAIMSSGAIIEPENLFQKQAAPAKKPKHNFKIVADNTAGNTVGKKEDSFQRKRDQKRYLRRKDKQELNVRNISLLDPS